MTQILDMHPNAKRNPATKKSQNRQDTENDYNSAEDIETDKNGKEHGHGLALQLPTPILQYNGSSSSTFNEEQSQEPDNNNSSEKNDQANLSSKVPNNSKYIYQSTNKTKSNNCASGTQPPNPNSNKPSEPPISKTLVQPKKSTTPPQKKADQSNNPNVEQPQQKLAQNANSTPKPSPNQNKPENLNKETKPTDQHVVESPKIDQNATQGNINNNQSPKTPVKPSTVNPRSNPRVPNQKSQCSNLSLPMKQSGQISTQNPQSQSMSKTKKKDLYILMNRQQHLANLKQAALYFEPLHNATEEDFELLLEDLNNDKQESIIEHDFDKGEVVNGAIEHVLACQEEFHKQELQKKEVEKFIQQQNELDQKFEAYERETNRILNEIIVERDERLGYVRYKQLEELKKHDEMWASDSKIRQYNKASNSLKVYRKQLQDLLNQGRFREAAYVQTLIDKLESEERIQATKLMQHDYNESLKKMKQRHQSELESQEKKWEIQILQMKQKRINDMNTLFNKQRKIDSLRATVSDADKIWNSTQMQRKKDMVNKKVTIDPSATPQPSRCRNAPSTSCSTRLSTRSNKPNYASQNEVSATIKLPPLKLSQSMPPTVPPMGFFSYR